ncbi:MAG TPA: NADH-quinone oxidoreductase subunit K [Anaerolineaceae bacterium]|nr:NADH-quinone oxidoreductase subunit K [Anaerolineaceae bacterium]
MSINIVTCVIILVLGLLAIGFYALLISRNLIKVVVALQILIKGAMVALVLAGNISGKVNEGQSLALTVIVADTIVAVIGLSLAVQVRRNFGTLDLKALTTLRR